MGRLRLSVRRSARVVVALIAVGITVIGLASVRLLLQQAHPQQATRATTTPASTPTPTIELTPDTNTAPSILPDGNDWTQYRFDLAGTGVNPESSFSSKNASLLRPRWVDHHFQAFESTPAESNGIVYIANGNSLYAFDLLTGSQVWRFDDIPQHNATISSSVAVDPEAGLAYYGTPDARVYAVHTRDGTQAWMTQLGDPAHGAFIWSSPLVVNHRVYIGLASKQDSPCVRGGVFALDAATGHIVWKHYMVPAGRLGGSVWSSLIAVPGKAELIATTGNPCPAGPSDAQQDAIVALNWNTGATLWQYTAVGYDDCDCDFGEGAVDFTYQGREYVVAGNKNGTVYAVTPTSHGTVALDWSKQITTPGFLGEGGIFEPPTYSNGLLFVAGGPPLDGSCQRGKLYALRPNSGAIVWSTCTSGQVVSPASATGDVLFVAQLDVLVAYQATTGRELWRAPQPGQAWGGVTIARQSVIVGTVSGALYCYSVPRSLSRQ